VTAVGAIRSNWRPFWRVGGLFLGIAVIIAVPFAIWGEQIETALGQDALLEWAIRYRSFAWLVAIALLVSDLILPIPNTVVMAGLGAIYGPLLGGIAATLGTCLSGLIGYAACRRFGPLVADRLLGDADRGAAERLFARHGAVIVAASRWLPVLSEAISCMAGLARMAPMKFSLALFCGAAPLGFTVAAIGHSGSDRPFLTLLACALVPLPLWFFVRALLPSAEQDKARSAV
jgi:uncharacterized membrane protein YdjX (TVP38/TMEM64 family)